MEERLWEIIANQCAPVLTDEKPSNLLILTKEEEAVFERMDSFPGISKLCLYSGERKSTWLLYRKDRLEAKLLWPRERAFLERYGYGAGAEGLSCPLGRLKERFAAYKEGRLEFPHEMGVFLGYPLGDVEGFIEHRGKDFLCSGYWKVYQDEQKAKRTFQLYRTVRNAVLRRIHERGGLYRISYPAS